MNVPKRQHYVPQMLLRRFTDEDGFLYWCNGSKIQKSRPKQVFFENHLYTKYNDDGEVDVSVENHLSIMEGSNSPIIEKIINSA